MKSHASRNLLVVDDDQHFLNLLKEAFHKESFGEIAFVSRPQEAVQALKHKEYDVVVLDYRLPLMDGDQLIAILQSIRPDTRFIVLTAAGGDEIESKFKGRGYFAFFQKGQIRIDELRTAISQAFQY